MNSFSTEKERKSKLATSDSRVQITPTCKSLAHYFKPISVQSVEQLGLNPHTGGVETAGSVASSSTPRRPTLLCWMQPARLSPRSTSRAAMNVAVSTVERQAHRNKETDRFSRDRQQPLDYFPVPSGEGRPKRRRRETTAAHVVRDASNEGAPESVDDLDPSGLHAGDDSAEGTLKVCLSRLWWATSPQTMSQTPSTAMKGSQLL